MRIPSTAALAKGLLCALAYVLAAAACLALSIPTGNSSPVWLPTGVALAAVLRWRTPMLPWIGTASLLVNLYLMAHGPGLGPEPLAAAVLVSAGNVLAMAVAYWVVRHSVRALRRESALVVHAYLLAAALAALIGGGIGGTALAIARAVTYGDTLRVIAQWSLGDLMALLLVTPLLAAWTSRRAWRCFRQRPAFGTAVLLLTCAATLLLYRSGPALQAWTPFLLLAPVLWAAHASGALAGTTAAAIVAAGTVWSTLDGAGPFATRDQLFSLLGLDLFLAVLAAAAMLVSNTAAGHQRDGEAVRPGRWPVATLALCLAITVAAWHAAATMSERRIEEQFRTIVDATWQQMDYRIGNYRRMLLAGKAFHDASEDVTADEWRAYTADFDIGHVFPGTLGLGYAEWVRPREADAFVARQRARDPAFRVWPQPAAFPAAVITYLEPDTPRNARAHGYNVMSDPARAAGLRSALATGAIGSTAPVTLVQDAGSPGQQGFLMFMPIYRRGMPTGTPEEREAALRGTVYSPFRIADMVGSMIGGGNAFTLRILDLHDGPPGRRIFDNEASAGPDAQRATRYVKPLVFTRTLPIDEAGHRWLLQFKATTAFETGVDRGSPLITLGLGATVSFLLFEIVRGLAAMRGRALAMAQEITRELKRQQRAASESEERFRLFTASVKSHAIIFLDSAGRVEAWNEGAANLFGYTGEQTVGRPPELWGQAGAAAALVGEAAVRGAAITVAELVRRDGSRFLGEAQLTAVRRDGELAGFALIVRDVTAAHEAEERQRQAVAIAESASRAKSAFVANMSHELRTPMNGVLGIAALMEKSRLDKDQRDLVRMIRTSGETLLAVLNDILDFSKIEAGRVDLHPEAVALDDIALACARLMAVQGGGRLRLLVDVAPALPPVIVADALRLEQILTNLLGNALKFTEHGSVTCRFAPGPHGTLCVSVADSGIGIDEEQRKRLFSPFAQADASTTRRFGGTGLGLTIARSLAELMGGTLGVASTPGHGSTFTLTVPLQPAPQAHDPYMLPERHCHLQVLLCMADAQQAAALAGATARWGWHLHIVQDAARAQALLSTPGGPAYELAIAGADVDGAQLMAALGAAPLPPGFALLRIVEGFAVPQGDVPFPATVVHAPATRAALYEAAIEARGTGLPTAEPPPADTGGPPLAGMHVLLAEDNAINQTVAIALLDFAGAAVTVAGNGREALARLREAPQGYDAVLMDVQMPEMDGLAAARAVRNELHLSVPIVAMTAGVTQEERDACSVAGMDGFIAKPVEEEEMIAALVRYRGVRTG